MPKVGSCVLEFPDGKTGRAKIEARYELSYSPDVADRTVRGVLAMSLPDGIRAQLAGRGEVVFSPAARANVTFVCYSKGFLEFVSDGPFPKL
jgi:hypothetical protein